MKNYYFLIIALMVISKAYTQDTSKVQIVFQTKLNQQIPLFKEVYLGDINTTGYAGSEFTYQEGTLTKKEFLFNAPHNGYFEKNKPVTLVMTDEHSYKVKFMVDPGIQNQKWLLSLPGKGYKNSRVMILSGLAGVLVSSTILVFVASHNSYLNHVYQADMNTYNFLPMGSMPTKPKLNHYTVPILLFSASVSSIVYGSLLHAKVKPSAVRIE